MTYEEHMAMAIRAADLVWATLEHGVAHAPEVASVWAHLGALHVAIAREMREAEQQKQQQQENENG